MTKEQHEAFGNLASSTGTWQGQFGYGGGFGYQQDATGLKLLGHRYYDFSTGRFLTRDPIKDGRNWYVYCDSDPVGFADETGLGKIKVSIRVVHFVGDYIRRIGGKITKEQAKNIRRRGGNVVISADNIEDARKQAKSIQEELSGDLTEHHWVGHPSNRPGDKWGHYQDDRDNRHGHTFYRGMKNGFVIPFANLGDQTREYYGGDKGEVFGTFVDFFNPFGEVQDIVSAIEWVIAQF